MKKLFFRSDIPCIAYLFVFFTGRKNPQNVYGTQLRNDQDQMMGGSK